MNPRRSAICAAAACALCLAALSAQAQPAAGPQPALEAPAPAPAPWPSPAADDRGHESSLPWVRIEQLRRGNRIVELRIVDPSGETRYTMVNREGRPPLSTQELSSGLSAPRFFKLEF